MKSADRFSRECLTKIFNEKKFVLDIGGGLRAFPNRGNRYDSAQDWARAMIEKNHIDYKIMDPVPDFHPDVIGDIHALPFEDNSLDAVICVSVLEHVENPIQAMREVHRVLKPGGYCFLYVPFLYYYHAEKGYYGDFWRFTEDAVRMLVKPFSAVELQNMRGATESWIHLSPLGRMWGAKRLAALLDSAFGKTASRQTSGYIALATK